MNEFDESIALAPAGPNAWTAHADPRREAGTGMFGGWTAALLLKAVLGDAADAGTPVSLSVHFLNAVLPNSALTRRRACSAAAARSPPGRRTWSPKARPARPRSRRS